MVGRFNKIVNEGGEGSVTGKDMELFSFVKKRTKKKTKV